MSASAGTLVLDIRGLEVRRRGAAVLQVEHLAVAAGGRLAVIGPNGAGKSTLLLTLARMLEPHAGEIRFCGQDYRRLSALEYRRQLALVMQSPLLLRASVWENVALGLRFRRIPRPEIEARVGHWLERLGIAHLAERRGDRLSGGEAQRVNLARALVLQPRLLLLDEPFSALDAPTRFALMSDFAALMERSDVAVVLVTHDLDEARFLAQQAAVLISGRLEQVGDVAQVFDQPASRAVADFVGMENLLPGRVLAVEEGRVQVAVDGTDVVLMAGGQASPGQRVWLGIRPEHLQVLQGEVGTAGMNRLWGVVAQAVPQGALLRIAISVGRLNLFGLIPSNNTKLHPGSRVSVWLPPAAIALIPRDDE